MHRRLLAVKKQTLLGFIPEQSRPEHEKFLETCSIKRLLEQDFLYC